MRVETKEQYKKVFTTFCRKVCIDETVPRPSKLYDELKRRNLKRSSYKFYVSAIRFCLLEIDERLYAHFNQLIIDDTSSREENFIKKPKKRKIMISPVELDIFENYAKKRYNSSQYAELGFLLLKGVILLGLRPCEWANVIISSGNYDVVEVFNAKYANESMDRGIFKDRVWRRANGKSRFLKLRGDQNDIENLRNLVKKIITLEKKTPWRTFSRAIQREIKIIADLAIKDGALPTRFRSLTIYHARHQFAADAKLYENVTGGHVAAMMGHISTTTAVRSYGRYRNKARSSSGWKLAVSPTLESINMVENRVIDYPLNHLTHSMEPE